MPFSPEASDWGKGEFVTDNSTSGLGVLDMAISPNGRRMIAVSNHESFEPGRTSSST